MRIKDVTGELLDWEQPHFFKAEYDLKRNVDIIGTLEVPQLAWIAGDRPIC